MVTMSIPASVASFRAAFSASVCNQHTEKVLMSLAGSLLSTDAYLDQNGSKRALGKDQEGFQNGKAGYLSPVFCDSQRS